MSNKKSRTEIYDDFYKNCPDEEMVELNLKFKIHPRWVKQFIGFLEYVEANSSVGHSSLVGFYADGDGDFRFRWKFADDDGESINKKVAKYFRKVRPDLIDDNCNTENPLNPLPDAVPEVLFDAG